MHYDDIEFKVKAKTDAGLPVPWEETPVCEILHARFFQAAESLGKRLEQAQVADRYARLLSAERGGAEVRWNRAGSQQGHYVRAKYAPCPDPDNYKRECQINTEGCTKQPDYFVEYEVDNDLDFSLEHDGRAYFWSGFACDWCAEEIYRHVSSYKMWRYRETDADNVTVTRAQESGWLDIVPDWSEPYFTDGSEPPDWDHDFPQSRLWAQHQRDKEDQP